MNVSLCSRHHSQSLAVGVGVAYYRFRPSFMALTRPITRVLGNLSFVLLLAAVIIIDPVHDILHHTQYELVMMEMYSANDWNANLLYSLWIMGI